MSKADLIPHIEWDDYTTHIKQRIKEPQYAGKIENPNADDKELVKVSKSIPGCAADLHLYWLVDKHSHSIIEARYEIEGCTFTIAVAETVCHLSKSKKVDHIVNISPSRIEKELLVNDSDKIPEKKKICIDEIYTMNKEAACIYKGVSLEELEESRIVCECARVSLSTLKEVIRLNDLTTVEQITDYTKAGAFCRSCVAPGEGEEDRDIYLVDLLKAYAKEKEDKVAEEKEKEAPGFKEMSLPQKIKPWIRW